MTDAWKDPRLPEKQLALNRLELAGNYPEHWKALLQCLAHEEVPKTVPFYDIGCGVGSTYALLRRERSRLQYCGIDFSDSMVEAARVAWRNPNVFHVDDYRTTTRDFSNGIVYCTGLLDLVEDGVKELARLLSFGSPHVILNRINVGLAQKLETYAAYDTITAYKYTFDYREFLDVIRAAGYSMVAQTGNCYLLRKNMP